MRPGLLLISAAVIAALQIGFLTWTIAGRAAVLRDGKEIVLKVEPIDPRDLLRGDYVRLGYDISTVPASSFFPVPTGEGDYEQKPVWVLVAKNEAGIGVPVAASFDRALLPPEGNDVILRGLANTPAANGTAFVNYGMERFYLPEGEGLQIEKDMRERPFFVVASVAEDGTAQIKAFRDGDTVLYEEPYY